MSLLAQIPGKDLYEAILGAFQARGSLDRHNTPIIIEGPILLQGEASAWDGNDAIVVVSVITDDFFVVTNKVNVVSPGGLYYRNSREILRYLLRKRLTQKNLVINIQGVFPEDTVSATQFPLEGVGLEAFVDLGANLSFLRDARLIVLRKRIEDIDRVNKTTGSSVTHAVAKRYERDPTLSTLLKELRGCNCQICGYTFETAAGELYCECHHLESLANGGLDVSKNMIVVCANCHKRMHYGNARIIEHDVLHIVIDMDNVVHTCTL